MRQTSIQLDEETIRQMRQLAGWWGLGPERHTTAVIQRCIERVHTIESMARNEHIDWFTAVDGLSQKE